MLYTYHIHSRSWGRGDRSIGYTGGDGDVIFLIYTLSFWGTWGQHIRIYTWGWGYNIHRIHSQSWGHGDSSMGMRIADIYSIRSLSWGYGDVGTAHKDMLPFHR